MKKRDLVTSLILLAVAIVTLLETYKLPIGTPAMPETGFFPLLLAIILGIFSLLLLGQAMMGKDREKAPSWVGAEGWKPLVFTAGALFVIGIFFERLGYLISTFLLIAFLMRATGPKKWWLVILFALCSALGSYLVFDVLLKTQLPAGFLGS